MQHYRITSSLFGAVFSRKSNTCPDNLVLRIIQPKSLLSTPVINHGIENEKHALDEYIKYQHTIAKNDLVVAPSGVIVNPSFSFLGVSHDGMTHLI